MLLSDFAFTSLAEDNAVLYLINPLKSRGIEKLARLYIKALITQKGSNVDDSGYGTQLIEIAGSTTDKDGHMVRAKVVDAVRDAVNWFENMQLNHPVDAEEMLKEVKILDVGYDVQTGQVNIKLYLLNNTGKMVAFGLAV